MDEQNTPRRSGRRLFRIVTENKNADQLRKMLSDLEIDYTMYCADGSWQGISECSLLIELDQISRAQAEAVALIIKWINTQTAVLLQEFPTRSVLL